MPDLKTSSKVSIIMSTYNRAAYIIETIESIRNQTYQNWELIIIDDGSDDNTEEVIEAIKDSRIQFYKAGRLGIASKIKNIGLEKVTGELIAFIDSDDLWAQTKLEKQLIVLQQYPEAGFSLTGGYNFRNLNEPLEYFYKQREGVRYDNVFISCFKSEVAGFTQALMFRKECLAVTGFFKEVRFSSDLDFILSLANHFKAVILYEPLFYRRLHNTNYSNLNWEKRHYQGLEMIRSYKNSLPPELFADSLFKSYINSGEGYLQRRESGKAIRQFLKAWKSKPFSIIPLKKTVKAALYVFKK
ncbi:MAG TPA: glycosyltransferase family 2 protein [Chitinophagaceae bacterium]|nr:glycosyltransferase family 2 protein [Chitinophagaceae bacterium]